MPGLQKSALRARMERELAALRLSLSSIQIPARCPDENELASRISECALSESLNRRLAVRIGALEDALRRMDVEDYGICEDCGERIPLRRLLAAPAVRLCVACQAERDREVVAVRRAVPALPVVPVPGTPIPHRLPGPEKRFSLPPALPARRRKTGTNRTTLTA